MLVSKRAAEFCNCQTLGVSRTTVKRVLYRKDAPIRSSPMKKRDLDQLSKEVSLLPSQAALVAGIPLSKFRSLHGNTRLSMTATENILSIMRLLQIGLSVFDNDKDASYRWVKSPNPTLLNYIPVELMLTIMGCNLVEEELKRIDYGILA